MMTCLKRVLIVVLLAAVAASATKCLTHLWRCSAEADYERARINLKPDDLNADDECVTNVPPVVVTVSGQTNSPERSFWQKTKDKWQTTRERVSATYKKGTDAVKRPYRETRHMVANMPEYIKALIVFQLATVVDAILVWIVIAIFLLKIFWWAVGKLFNAWIDGVPSARPASDSVVEILDNGDAIIHIHQLREKKESK